MRGLSIVDTRQRQLLVAILVSHLAIVASYSLASSSKGKVHVVVKFHLGHSDSEFNLNCVIICKRLPDFGDSSQSLPKTYQTWALSALIKSKNKKVQNLKKSKM